MSVDVKTPTRTQFEHPEFPCGERSDASPHLTVPVSFENIMTVGRPSTSNIPHGKRGAEVLTQVTQLTDASGSSADCGGRFPRKRKLSDRAGGAICHPGNRKKAGRFGKTGEKIVLPSKFLLGGNITDPLNLNALYDDEIGRVLNEKTPQSSPLPLPEYKKQVQVLIPPNINDPLNLNVVESEVGLTSPKFGNKKKKHKHKKKRSSIGAGDKSDVDTVTVEQASGSHEHTEEPPPQSHLTQPVSIDTTFFKDTAAPSQRFPDIGDKLSKLVNKIVSPVIPQLTPKTKKLKRLSSEQPKVDLESSSKNTSASKDSETTEDTKKHTPQRPKARKQLSQTDAPSDIRKKPSANKFVYGNYNRYYGYRNPGEERDSRLEQLRGEWFKGRDVLDIGCNIGHVTLSIARDHVPRRIVGMDIDGKLIAIAKKNVRHYMTNSVVDTSQFPVSLPLTYGPIAAPPAASSRETPGFPQNVMFVHGNYVLEKEDELDLVQEEYDCILALSVSKWIHLNFGDAGLKRFFKRIHKQLRPGGKFILEPQPWPSYKKKKKLTDTIFKNFQQIRLRPDQFTEYLLSRDVGFVACEHLGASFNKSHGFQRGLQVYTKSESNSTPLEGVTPLMDINCTPGTTPQLYAATPYKDSTHATPKFEMCSSGMTPSSSCQDTPTYLYSTWSVGGTPRNDSDAGEGGTPGRTDHDGQDGGQDNWTRP